MLSRSYFHHCNTNTFRKIVVKHDCTVAVRIFANTAYTERLRTQWLGLLLLTTSALISHPLLYQSVRILRIVFTFVLTYDLVSPPAPKSLTISLSLFFFATAPLWAVTSFTKFLDHTQRRTAVGRTPLDEWSTSRRDLHLATHNTHNRKTSMPPGGTWTHNLSRRAAPDPRLRPLGLT